MRMKVDVLLLPTPLDEQQAPSSKKKKCTRHDLECSHLGFPQEIFKRRWGRTSP
uniref:Uncharacterized protein n=1 Tax=Zea mays TaxID=4577 RepID=C4J1D2_MAIZE|nr:unknown [Zea mays]